MLVTGIPELITIPIYLLRIDTVARTVLRMLVVTAVVELAPAVATPFFTVQGGAWLEDCPEVLEGDDFVLDVVCLCGDGVFKFCF